MTIRDARTVQGGDEAERKLLPWLEKQIQGLEIEGDVRLQLFRSGREGESYVDEWPFALDDELQRLAIEVVESAERDALVIKKRVRYGVRLKDRAQCLMFTLEVPWIDEDEDDERDDDFEESPTRRGLVAQAQRFAESFAKLGLSAAKAGKDDQYRRNRDLSEENGQLRQMHVQMMKLVQDLLNQQQQRDIAFKEWEGAERRKEEALGVFKRAGSVLLPRLLGEGAGEVAGLGSWTPLEQMLEAFVQTIEQDPNKLGKLTQVLEPADMMMLSQIHQAVAAKREQEMRAAQSGATQGGGQQMNGAAAHQPNHVPTNGAR